MLMINDDSLKLDPQIEGQLQEQFEIQPEKVRPYLEHRERLSTFMDFRVDYAFKYILGHKRILLKLINDLLPVEVDDIEYLGNEIPVMSAKEKRVTFDVICTARGTGEKFLAEMQCLPDADMDDRLLYYGCSLVHNQIERGDESYLLRPVYVLCVADYIRRHSVAVQEDRFFFSYRFLEASNVQDCLSGNLQFFFLELPRLRRAWETLETDVERWCYLFKNLNKFAKTPADQAGFEDVFSIAQTGELEERVLRKYVTSMITEYDKKVIGEYFHREGYAKGKAEGLVEGMVKGKDEGIAEEKRSTVKNLKAIGASIETIIAATQLSEEEIEAIQ